MSKTNGRKRRAARNPGSGRSFEDYLEAMLRLQQQAGAARVRDLSATLGVHKSTVTATLQALAARGLVVYSRYTAARLTPAGAALAARTTARHVLIRDYLVRMLLLDEPLADANACRMEHILDAGVISRLEVAARFAVAHPRASANWRQGFGRFARAHSSVFPGGQR